MYDLIVLRQHSRKGPLGPPKGNQKLRRALAVIAGHSPRRDLRTVSEEKNLPRKVRRACDVALRYQLNFEARAEGVSRKLRRVYAEQLVERVRRQRFVRDLRNPVHLGG